MFTWLIYSLVCICREYFSDTCVEVTEEPYEGYKYKVKQDACTGFTWQSDISQHRLLAVFDAADLGEVHVQGQEGHAAEEGHGAHEDAVVAGVLVAVEDAVLLYFVGAVDVALVGDAAEDHDGEELQEEGRERRDGTVRKGVTQAFCSARHCRDLLDRH